jgi:hypothetical protein
MRVAGLTTQTKILRAPEKQDRLIYGVPKTRHGVLPCHTFLFLYKTNVKTNMSHAFIYIELHYNYSTTPIFFKKKKPSFLLFISHFVVGLNLRFFFNVSVQEWLINI